MDGRKDVLGMWVGENESAKFWAGVLNSLRNRGVDDILIACTDNLTGFSQAIEAVFPKTDIQNCIIHQLRNSSKYVSYKDIKALILTSRWSILPLPRKLLWTLLTPLQQPGAANIPRYQNPGTKTGIISAHISSFHRSSES